MRKGVPGTTIDDTDQQRSVIMDSCRWRVAHGSLTGTIASQESSVLRYCWQSIVGEGRLWMGFVLVVKERDRDWRYKA